MYIGNTPTTQVFTFGTDSFDGNGVTLQFTLSRSVPNVYAITVIVNNVPQNPFTNSFSVSNNILTFTEAPSIGTKNIWVFYNSYITQLIQPGIETVGTGQLVNYAVTPTKLDRKYVEKDSDTGAAKMPVGTTAQRPTGEIGMYRMNSTTGQPEWYDATAGAWKPLFQGGSYSVGYAMLGGGGGASGGISGRNYGSGGSAGVYRSGTIVCSSNSVYTVVVGAGGSGVNSGTPGSATSSSIVGPGTSVAATPGVGPDYASFAGGNNADYSGTNNPSGGASSGAGAGAGGNASGFNGGPGANVTITGSSQTLGGGGGGTNGSTNGSGGSGGGGSGSFGGNGGNGSANTGSGGGGSNASATGGSGGSGVVYLSIPTANYTGVTTGSPSVTTSGAYTILKFTQSGTYTA